MGDFLNVKHVFNNPSIAIVKTKALKACLFQRKEDKNKQEDNNRIRRQEFVLLKDQDDKGVED